MYTKDDIGRIISDRFVQRGGKGIPYYLARWMVDYVFEAIKIALIEDGKVGVRNLCTITRIDVPAHTRLLPNGTVANVAPKVKIKVDFSDKYLDDVFNGKFEEVDKTNAH